MDIYNRLQKIHVLLDDGDRRSLSTIDLSPSQYNLLQHLHDKGGPSGLTIGELADLLICTPSNATRLVQRLEQQGLVELNRDTRDRRLVWARLTEDGAARFASARFAHSASITRRFSAFETANIENLDILTQIVTSVLEADLKALNAAAS